VGNDRNNEDDNNEEIAGADEVCDGLRRSSDERGSLMLMSACYILEKNSRARMKRAQMRNVMMKMCSSTFTMGI